MQRALTLLQCERCSVLLLEDIDSPVRHLLSCNTMKLFISCKTLLSLLPNVTAAGQGDTCLSSIGREVLQDL